MEGVTAAAHEFLLDAGAIEAYLDMDRRRDDHLRELHDAFIAFRDGDEPIQRLVKRIKAPLWETYTPPRGGPPQNLWGFSNEDERLFPERFAASGSRLPDTDLASLFRGYLEDEGLRTDDQRIQMLLAFGEFVASLDARARDGDPRLGVGPAANFLTFAWHCMSLGAEPVFVYTTNRAVKAFEDASGTKDGSTPNLERRFQTFFALARRLGRALEAAPPPMRRGWGVEHALEWILDHYGGRLGVLIQEPVASAATGRSREADGGGRPVIVPASGVHVVPARAPRELEPAATAAPARAQAVTRKEEPALPAFASASSSGPATEARRAARAPDPTPAEDDTRARQRARIGELTKKQKVVVTDAPPMLDKSGAELADVLPPDRTPPVGMPRPDEAPKAEAPRPEPPRPEPPRKPEVRLERVDAPKTDSKREPRRPEPRSEPKPEPKPERVVESWWAAAVQTAPEKEKERKPAPEPAPVGHDDRTEELDAGLSPRQPEKAVAPTRRLEHDEDSAVDVQLDALVGELRGEVVEVSRGEPARGVPPPDRLARDLFLDPSLTGEVSAALEQRGRVLLVGPPWAGKTHVARRLAIHLAGHLDRVLIIRLHAALSYADLLGREPGLVRAFCERARDDHAHRHVLVLDELDRAEGARALGELTGALSERGQAVSLGSTGASFLVPRNLLVVATAREAPRDPAFTGRFPVVPLPADPEVLRRYLTQCRPALEWVAGVLRAVNARLTAERRALQVGHGVFMDPDLDADRVRLIWRRDVLPLLAAHGVEREAFDLDRFRREG